MSGAAAHWALAAVLPTAASKEPIATTRGPRRTAPTLEGHLNYRVLAGGMQRAGASSTHTPGSIRLTSFNMSGMTVSFAAGDRNGGNFVDVCTVARGARIIS